MVAEKYFSTFLAYFFLGFIIIGFLVAMFSDPKTYSETSSRAGFGIVIFQSMIFITIGIGLIILAIQVRKRNTKKEKYLKIMNK